MFQKRNDFELVELLRQRPAHIRNLAAVLGLSPSTVMRILHRLRSEGAVDYRREGKNSVYRLKKTPEAIVYIQMTEQYKLLKLLQQPRFRLLYKEMIASTEGELVVLYGSHAKGTAADGSDIDLYVETRSQALKQKIRNISGRISVKIGGFGKNTEFGQELIRNHIILQGSERFYRLLQ